MGEQSNMPHHASGFWSWLKTTEAWQRLVVRAGREKSALTFLLYATVVCGVLMVVQFQIVAHVPVLKLEEMDQRYGVLEGAGFSGKYQNNRWISLRLADGELIKYDANTAPGKIEFFQKLIGQHITVWSQNRLIISRFGREEVVREIQHNNTKLLGYNYEFWIRETYHPGFGWYILPVLMIVLPLITLWVRHGKPTETTNNKGSNTP